jgi:hypothetical protein
MAGIVRTFSYAGAAVAEPAATIDAELHSRLAALCAEGWRLFEEFDLRVRDHEFHPFVAADYERVLAALISVRTPGARFLEWGSATGVITIMADLLGFEAFGIEIDSSLVRSARALATQFDSRATFVAGSFLPSGYRWQKPERTAVDWTATDGESGYLQLGRALDDFDVVFAYPWGGEAAMMQDLMKRYGRDDALLLLHDTNDGVRGYRRGKEIPLGP